MTRAHDAGHSTSVGRTFDSSGPYAVRSGTKAHGTIDDTRPRRLRPRQTLRILLACSRRRSDLTARSHEQVGLKKLQFGR